LRTLSAASLLSAYRLYGMKRKKNLNKTELSQVVN